MSYDGSAARRATVSVQNNPARDLVIAGRPARKFDAVAASSGAVTDWPKRPDGSPDIDRMKSSHRRAFDAARLNRRFG